MHSEFASDIADHRRIHFPDLIIDGLPNTTRMAYVSIYICSHKATLVLRGTLRGVAELHVNEIGRARQAITGPVVRLMYSLPRARLTGPCSPQS